MSKNRAIPMILFCFFCKHKICLLLLSFFFQIGLSLFIMSGLSEVSIDERNDFVFCYDLCE
jgi:hypothetical protein